MKFITTSFLILFSSILLLGQTNGVGISVDGRIIVFNPIKTKGYDFISLNELADSLKIGKYYNASSSKFELKFTGKYLKFTGRNPFIVITDRNTNKSEIIQIPVSVLRTENDLYIPVKYCLKLIGNASGKEIKIAEGKFTSPLPKKEIEISETPSIVENEIKGELKYDISNLLFDVKANGTLITIKLDKKEIRYAHSIEKDVLYLNIAGLITDEKAITKIPTKGLVKSIKVKNVKSNTQLAFSLKQGYATTEVFHNQGSNDLIVTIHNKLLSDAAIEFNRNVEKWNFDVVVIDPGHGGKDPGAIGINGVREKDINLAIALMLGELIEKNMKGIKVVYTRSTDKFVELYRRGKIANENNGKLFISIHCNSTPKKPTNRTGFEIYLLRPGRTTEAISIAEQENSVIDYEDNPSRYQELTDENFILVSMAHSSFMRYSEQFSDILNKQFSNSLALPSLGIKQAGFYVLVGASMPNVLIETGFLSNKKDAEYLSSKNGQSSIAQSIFDAVKDFKTSYEQALSQ